MSLAIKYEHLDDASMRLRNTVVRYKGDPVYITNIRPGTGDEIFRVYFQPLPVKKVDGFIAPRKVRLGPDGPEFVEEAEEERRYISSRNFDISPFKMGYVNDPKGAAYCSRLPTRKQQQGLCAENFGASSVGGNFNFNSFLSCPGVVDMVHGRYPSLAEAQRLLAEKQSPLIAFHRDFAISRDEILGNLFHVFYRGNKVGAYLDGGLILGDKYRCLKESLIELGVPVK